MRKLDVNMLSAISGGCSNPPPPCKNPPPPSKKDDCHKNDKCS